jgi:hypothetical protein
LWVYLLLAEIVRKVGDHDLVLGRDTILGRPALSRLTRSTGFRVGSVGSTFGSGFVGCFSQWCHLTRDVGGLSFSLCLLRVC